MPQKIEVFGGVEERRYYMVERLVLDSEHLPSL